MSGSSYPLRHVVIESVMPAGRATPIHRRLDADVPRGRPQVGLAPEADLYEEVAKLDARTKHASQLKHAIAMPESAKHGGLERELLPVTIHNAHSENRRMRLGRDAIHHLAESGV